MTMERQFFPTSVDFLAASDPEARGRKRRRDPIHVTFSRPQHNPSTGSTLRGRCRHRSPSRLAVASRTNSRGVRDASPSTSKRRLVAVITLLPENHRRSKSPSRSRPGGDPNMLSAKRRRQRTQSRSRPYDERETLSVITQPRGTTIELSFLFAQEKEEEVISVAL